MAIIRLFLVLPIPEEGWDGGTHDAGSIAELAPTLTLRQKRREPFKLMSALVSATRHTASRSMLVRLMTLAFRYLQNR